MAGRGGRDRGVANAATSKALGLRPVYRGDATDNRGMSEIDQEAVAFWTSWWTKWHRRIRCLTVVARHRRAATQRRRADDPIH